MYLYVCMYYILFFFLIIWLIISIFIINIVFNVSMYLHELHVSNTNFLTKPNFGNWVFTCKFRIDESNCLDCNYCDKQQCTFFWMAKCK